MGTDLSVTTVPETVVFVSALITAFVMVKIIDTQTDNWAMYDNKRNPFNLDTSQRLRANDTQAETTSPTELILYL